MDFTISRVMQLKIKPKRDPLVSKLPITDPSAFIITEGFRTFIVGILKYRCLLKESTVSKYFDTESSMKFIRQAFIHKSAGRTNYEYQELKGDPVVNLAVSDWIDTNFPNVKNVEWGTRIFHNLKSSNTLAQIAIDNGFGEFLVYGDLMKKEIEHYHDNLDESELYLGMYEDTFEALFGAITLICKDKFPQESSRGISYNACYNLMSSYLSEIEVKTSYQDAWDPVTRLKELSDSKGWDKNYGCKFNNILTVFEVNNLLEKDHIRFDRHYELYKYSYQTTQWNEPFVQIEGNKFIAFGYGCINNGPRLLSVAGSGSKKKAKHIVAENVLTKLNAMNITNFSKFPDYHTWDLGNTSKQSIIENNKVPQELKSSTTISNSSTKPIEKIISMDNIDHNELDNDTLCKIPNIEALNLSQNTKVNDRGLLCLARQNTLIALNLNNNKTITNKGISTLTGLQRLSLENNFLISDVGIENLINLKHLNINNNTRITIKGVSKLTNLTSLTFDNSNLNSYESKGALRQLLPYVKIL